jgi:PDZ domain
MSLRIALSIFFALAVMPASARTVHSLGQVPGQLKSPEAKSYWAEQMAGKKGPDGLGVRLPPALEATAVVRLLLPDGDHAKLAVVGAEPWPNGGKDRYVAIVCAGGAAFDPDNPVCAAGADNGAPLKVYLGVIEASPGVTPRLVARLGPLDAKVAWDFTDMPAPDNLGDGAPESYDRFDLAPYRIEPGETAFGLRVGWSSSYSGGGAQYTALLLFAIERGALRQVLAAPMSAYRDIAGDWHAGGTRDHDITDESNILVVSRDRLSDHFDLVAKARHWNPVKRTWASIIGLGIEYGTVKDGIAVKAVTVGGPGAQVGIESDDVIIAIDDHPTAGLSVRAIRERMIGVVGGPVRLTVRRDGHPPFEKTARRALITLAPSPHLRYRWSAKAGRYRVAACIAPCL